jgi:hypothetical protein
MYADEVPPALGDRLGPVVARLEIWRDKGLPAVLPVDLGGVPSAVLARSLGGGSIHRICPAFPYKSEPVEMQR